MLMEHCLAGEPKAFDAKKGCARNFAAAYSKDFRKQVTADVAESSWHIQRLLRAAGTIQRVLRGAWARRCARRTQAAERIQRSIRGWHSRRERNRRVTVRNEREAAETIQSAFRGAWARRRAHRLRAVERIQRLVRGAWARRRACRIQAAERIQRSIRDAWARRRTNRFEDARSELWWNLQSHERRVMRRGIYSQIAARPPDEGEPPPLEVTHDNSSESENSAPEDAHACSKKVPPRKDTGPHLQMQSYDQDRQAMFSTDTLLSARGRRRAGGDGATGRRRRSSRRERRRAGREKGEKKVDDSRREKLVQDGIIELMNTEQLYRCNVNGWEASKIITELAKTPDGPEWLKEARKVAEEHVDARTRSGIPLARFTEEEERRWCEDWGEEEDEVYMGDGFD